MSWWSGRLGTSSAHACRATPRWSGPSAASPSRTVERFLAWAAGTYVNVKAVENGRVYARRSVPNRNRRVSPVSVLAALMFRGVVTREYLWGPVLPSWYVERYWDRPYGTIPRESIRALARYVTRMPEQLRDLLDVLRGREWGR